MISKIISFLLSVLLTSIAATGLVLVLSFVIKPFGLWVVANIAITEGLYIGLLLLVFVYMVKKMIENFLEYMAKRNAKKAIERFCKDDIKETMEAIKANESISKRREQLLKENKDLVKKYMNGDLPLSKEVKEALKKYPDGEENFK